MTLTGILPTGRRAPAAGWVHGRYLTEVWHAVHARWAWQDALGSFAQALAIRSGLAGAVTWRGFYAVDGAGALHWWKPNQPPHLANDGAEVAWVHPGDTRDRPQRGATFHSAVAVPFLADFHDPETVVSGGVLPGPFEVRSFSMGASPVAIEADEAAVDVGDTLERLLGARVSLWNAVAVGTGQFT